MFIIHLGVPEMKSLWDALTTTVIFGTALTHLAEKEKMLPSGWHK